MKEFLSIFQDIFLKKKISLFLVQIMIIFSSLLEILPIYILSISISFISYSVYGEIPGFINEDTGIMKVFLEHDHFLNIFILFVIFALLIITFFNWLALRFVSNFSEEVGNEICSKCFKEEINNIYEKKSSLNLSDINSKIFSDCEGVITAINGFFQFISKSIVIVILSATLLIVNPTITIIMIITVSILYSIILLMTTNKFRKNSEVIASSNNSRMAVIKNSFNSYREIFIYRKEQFFLKRFNEFGILKARAAAKNSLYTFGPRYFVELTIFLLIIVSILILSSSNSSEGIAFVGSLSIFGLSGIKLLPAFQAAYFGLSTVESNKQHIINVMPNIRKKDHNVKFENTNERIKLSDSISFHEITYHNGQFSLGPIDLFIPKGALIGLAGKSGSGKSTLIDLMVGFKDPTYGKIKIDSSELHVVKDQLYNSIGFVPQDIAFIEGSLRDNLILSLDDDKVPDLEFEESLYLSGLELVMKKRNLKLDSHIGFDQLSGGEKQKIAFCRSLLRKPDILILDEFTSSIDAESKDEIIKNLNNLAKAGKTIIFSSHQFYDFRWCDRIIFLEEGNLVGYDNFETLLSNSKNFKKIVDIQKDLNVKDSKDEG